MLIVIRTDASVFIGSGHVMRCITIAKKLRERGVVVNFWMEHLEGNLIKFVVKEGFKVIQTPIQADMYIIDHYLINNTWEEEIRKFTDKIMVIDDLARNHDCDILLDQNVTPHYETRYEGKVPTHCITLLGPKYLIMREEFLQQRLQLRPRGIQINRLIIFMGGSDPTNETMKVLNALLTYNFAHVDVVVGSSNPKKEKIERICALKKYHFHCQINNIAQLMLLADFAVGAGGSALWERCYLGLPSSSTIVADNQREITNYAGQLGVTINLGWHDQVTTDTYRELLGNLQIEGMSEKGLKLTENKRPNSWLHEILELMK